MAAQTRKIAATYSRGPELSNYLIWDIITSYVKLGL